MKIVRLNNAEKFNNNTLNFLGNGSCFNTAFGNNSAYHIDKEKQSLLLIDCGESIFERIIKQKILEGIRDIKYINYSYAYRPCRKFAFFIIFLSVCKRDYPNSYISRKRHNESIFITCRK